MKEKKKKQGVILEGKVIPAKRGRKTLYKEHYKDDLVDLMRQGKSATQVAAAWGISRQTLHTWLKDKEDLKEAYQTAKTAGEAFWEDVGNAAVFGQIKGFNTKVFEMNMRNRFGWGVDNQTNQTINIENMQINNMSEKELDAQIALKIKELGLEDGNEQDEDSEA